MATRYFAEGDLTAEENDRFGLTDEHFSTDSQGLDKFKSVLIKAHKSRDIQHGVGYYKIVDGKEVQVENTPDFDREYRTTKIALLIVEVLAFVFFLSFGVAGFGLAVVEADMGVGTWPIGRPSMIAIITIYAILGAALLGSHVFLSVKFSKVGEEQLDDLAANAAALFTMFITTLGLLSRYFVLTIDDSTDDHSLRRLIYVTIEGFGLFSVIIIVRSLSRHTAVARKVIIDHQFWRTQGIEMINKNAQTDGRIEHFVRQYITTPGYGRIGFLVLMGVYTSTLLSLTIWLLVKGGVAVDAIPSFNGVYLGYFVTMGVMITSLWFVWVCWSVEAKYLKGPFAAHFDVYYLTHMILPVSVIFMLIGYHYVYSQVPDNFFDVGATIVPALKFAYFQKIVMIQLLLLPLLAMGIAKGSAMLSNIYPVNIQVIKKILSKSKV